MRHQKAAKKFSRTSAHRLAMWRNMTTSLIIHERIQTTDEKAKQLRRHVEHMITLAKKAKKLGDSEDKDIAARQLHLRRQALSFIREKEAVQKLFSELADRFAERPGGYTRILKIGMRRGDGASMSYIELLGEDEEVGAAKPKKKTRKTAARKTKKEKPAEVKAEAAEEAEALVEEVDQVEANVAEEPIVAEETETAATDEPEEKVEEQTAEPDDSEQDEEPPADDASDDKEEEKSE